MSVSITSSMRLPAWSVLAPALGFAVLWVASYGWSPVILASAGAACLLAAVVSGVHHAEVVAHKVGEPFGTLVLALAVTIIEVALIISIMESGQSAGSALARDTVYSTILLILNGIVGLCLLVGGSHFREQNYAHLGTSASLTTLSAISVLTLVLPNFTVSVPGPYYTTMQLGLISAMSLVLYGTFVLVQTVRHRDYFLPADTATDESAHIPPPGLKLTLLSLLLLIACLTVVILLAKSLAPLIEQGVRQIGAPVSVVGVIISAVVLLPEGLAALRAARRNRLQTSLNLALGSALATIGLTIPAVSLIAIYKGWPLLLGLDGKSTILLLLSLFIASLSLSTGRSTILQGVVHLVLLATYLLLTFKP